MQRRGRTRGEAGSPQRHPTVCSRCCRYPLNPAKGAPGLRAGERQPVSSPACIGCYPIRQAAKAGDVRWQVESTSGNRSLHPIAPGNTGQALSNTIPARTRGHPCRQQVTKDGSRFISCTFAIRNRRLSWSKPWNFTGNGNGRRKKTLSRRDALPTAAGLRISGACGRVGGEHPRCRGARTGQ